MRAFVSIVTLLVLAIYTRASFTNKGSPNPKKSKARGKAAAASPSSSSAANSRAAVAAAAQLPLNLPKQRGAYLNYNVPRPRDGKKDRSVIYAKSDGKWQ